MTCPATGCYKRSLTGSTWNALVMHRDCPYAVAMLENIPTHLIAGPLGAGKTTLLRQLLHQRPQAEQWAILINEFGQIGIDAALLQRETTGVSLAEVAGGCLCCVNGLPFQVGLNRLLRKSRPNRLFIEASGLGHPLSLLQQLSAPPWQGILNVQPLIMVLDARKLAEGVALADAQHLALPHAGLLVLNKSEDLDDATRQRLTAGLPGCRFIWCSEAHISLESLPGRQAHTGLTGELPALLPTAPTLMPVWRSIDDWHCQAQAVAGNHSVGWKMHPDQVFDLAALHTWLLEQRWLRAKGVVHTNAGWRAFNALPGELVHWAHTDCHTDNRIELITEQCPDRRALEQGLRAVAQSD